MPRTGRVCRTCGTGTIPTVTPTRLVQYLQEASGDLSYAHLPNLAPEDQPGDDDPRVLVHRRDKALATLRWAIDEATRTECALCARPPGAHQG
jgi:hypothetical protein